MALCDSLSVLTDDEHRQVLAKARAVLLNEPGAWDSLFDDDEAAGQVKNPQEAHDGAA